MWFTRKKKGVWADYEMADEPNNNLIGTEQAFVSSLQTRIR
jgi:hypothetical protein